MYKNAPPVPFGVSAPYQKDNGLWYVTVTIDNTSQIERLATDVEMPPADDLETVKVKKK